MKEVSKRIQHDSAQQVVVTLNLFQGHTIKRFRIRDRK